MLIGKLAEKTSVSIDTIRYYEREGLIEPVSVRESGYREFDDAVAERLLFVTRAKKLGFALKEIRDLLALKDNPDTTCKQVKAQAEKKLAEVVRKIETLQEIKQEIEALAAVCKSDESGLESCPIVKTLDGKEKP